MPAGEVLETAHFLLICLLSSSLTIHFAGKLLEGEGAGVFCSCGCSPNRSWRPSSVTARARNARLNLPNTG